MTTIGYFQVDDEGFSIAIVEKKFWEKNQCLSDSGLGIVENKLPAGFFELTDSIYEYDGEIEEAIMKLKSIGLEPKELF